MHTHLHTRTHNGEVERQYLTIVCALSICSLLATLLHSVPYPNSIVIYNFSLLGLAYVFHRHLQGTGYSSSYTPTYTHRIRGALIVGSAFRSWPNIL